MNSGLWGWLTNLYNQVYRLDPYASPVWQTVANMPTARAGSMPLIYGDNIYVIGGGGESSSDASYAIEEYDVPSNSWQSRVHHFSSLAMGLHLK